MAATESRMGDVFVHDSLVGPSYFDGSRAFSAI